MLTFPTHLFNPARISARLVGVATSAGETLSGITDTIRTDGGGYWQISLMGIELYNDDLLRAWRAWEAELDGGVTQVLVPVPDVRLAPRPVVGSGFASPSPLLAGSVEAYFPEAVGFTSPFIVATATAAAGLRATQLTINVTQGSPLEGGETFAIAHPAKGRRIYRVGRVLSRSGNNATVSVRPPLRESIASGTALDFDWPSVVATMLPEIDISPEIQYGRQATVDITFREAFSSVGSTGGGGGPIVTPPVDPVATTVTPTVFTDSLVNIDRGTHIETSPLARVIFTTSATSVTVNGYCNLFSRSAELSELGVAVNGEYLQSIPAGANGNFSATLTLPAGEKTITFTNGAQSKPPGEALLGTFLKSVTANAPLTRVNPAPGSRTYFVVDSIGVGDSASIPTKLSYIAWLRKSTTDSIVVYGWGYNGLLDVAGTAEQRIELVNLLKVGPPARVVLAIGTNDYGLNKGSAATFQSAYASLLNAIQSDMPAASVLAVVPLLRANENTPNSTNNTLNNYRNAIAQAALGKNWVTVVDATPWVPVNLMQDGLHPDDYGHWLYASSIDTYLGYTVGPYSSTPIVATDANGRVDVVDADTFRINKIAGGNNFNGGFGGQAEGGDFRYRFDFSALQDVVIGFTTNPYGDSGFGDMQAALYFASDAANNIYKYDLSVQGGGAGTYSATDVIWVDRTDSTITWKKGPYYPTATVLRTGTVSGSVFLDFCKYATTGTIDVTVNPGNGTQPVVADIVSSGGIDITKPSASVFRLTKSSGGNAFNAGAYGQPQAGAFRYKMTVPTIGDIVVGVNAAASASSGYDDIDFGIYLDGTGAVAFATETSIGGPINTYAAGEIIWVDRTGTTVTFKKGAAYDSGTVLRSGTVSGTVAFDVSLFQQGLVVDIQKVS